MQAAVSVTTKEDQRLKKQKQEGVKLALTTSEGYWCGVILDMCHLQVDCDGDVMEMAGGKGKPF